MADVKLVAAMGGGSPVVKPTREQLARIFCTMQGVRTNTSQLGPNVPSWGPEIGMLTRVEDRRATFQAHRTAGATHIGFGIYGHYQRGDVAYPNGICAWNDFTNDLPAFVRLIGEAVDNGLLVMMGLGADELPFAQVGAMAPALKAALGSLSDYVVWQFGMDSVVPIGNDGAPVYPNLQPMIDMVLNTRAAAGGDAVLAFMLPNGWAFWGPDQYAGSGSYTSPMGQAIDTWLQESSIPPPGIGPSPRIVSGEWDAEHNDYAPIFDFDASGYMQLWQGAGRTVPNYRAPADQPFDIPVLVHGGPQDGQIVPVSSDTRTPPRYSTDTPRGKSYWIALEQSIYLHVRNQISLVDVQTANQYITAVGYDAGGAPR